LSPSVCIVVVRVVAVVPSAGAVAGLSTGAGAGAGVAAAFTGGVVEAVRVVVVRKTVAVRAVRSTGAADWALPAVCIAASGVWITGVLRVAIVVTAWAGAGAETSSLTMAADGVETIGAAGSTACSTVGAETIGGGGAAIIGADGSAAGTSCAKAAVEDKARTAAIAVRAGRRGVCCCVMRKRTCVSRNRGQLYR
jgi:hypothetical protein